MKQERAIAAICLAAAGITALHYGESEIAATCFGFIGGWLLRNGYNAAKTKEKA